MGRLRSRRRLTMHVLGAVVAAAAVVALLRRWGVWWWLSSAAALPGLLVGLAGDPGAASSAAALLLGAAFVLALWRAAPPPAAWVVAALLAAGGLVAARVLGGGDWQLGPVSWAAVLPPAVVALGAAAGLGRALGSGLQLACAVLALTPVLVVVVTWGDAYSPLTWWPAAGALGVTALLRGRRGAATERAQSDAADEAALAALGDDPLAPVAIVIAAFNEAQGLPAVLSAMPDTVCGLAADVVVVDDGSSDGTADAARASGRCRVLACAVNRGQGAALRLGYRAARTRGATYVVTTDADGQYDVADIPAVLGPVVEGRADFVTGSRRLGALHNKDRVRQAGTYVFAWLASALLGQHLTDTSFGLRALRADVTGVVTLNQPQYQASELLVGVASHGFRVLEVPGTMHRRSAGSSKKGRNLVYGCRYAGVMLGTWLREGAPRPVAEVAPALGANRGRRGRPAP